MWFDDAVVYQIYPLGLCGAPLYNDGQPCACGTGWSTSRRWGQIRCC